MSEGICKNIRFLAISDIHNSGMEGVDPKGFDAMLVAGDFKFHGWSSCYEEERYRVNDDPFFTWCNEHPDFPVFLIPGNHDRVVERCPDWLNWPANVIRLDAGSVTEFKGLSIFGTPWTPIYHRHGAFDIEEGELSAKYAEIPKGLDILVAHAMPRLTDAEGNADVVQEKGHVGSKALRDAILAKRPKVVVCGHLHTEDHAVATIGGTQVVNVGRIHGRDYYTAAFSPAIVEFGADARIGITTSKRI